MPEVVIARKSPFEAELEEGKSYWWCACGRSATQPFCDGSHKDTGIEPVKHVAEKSGKVWFCGCKNTRSSPLCDGTHATL